jgi:rhamnogalacturonyl hydrolase YesR
MFGKVGRIASASAVGLVLLFACGDGDAPNGECRDLDCGSGGGPATKGGGGGAPTTSGGASAGGDGGAVTGGSGANAGAAGSNAGGQAGAGGSGDGGAEAGASTGGVGAAGAAGAAGVGGAEDPFERDAVASLMRRVADHEIARFGTTTDNGWVRATFHAGLLAASRALNEPSYAEYTRAWGAANDWQLHVNQDSLRHADNQACVQSYAELYLDEPTPANAGLIEAAQTTFDEMVAAPLPGRDEWWWCDALFMAPPALARVASATGNEAYITLMHDMFWDTTDLLFDPTQSLFWRDAGYVGRNVYWARGNGWVTAGIARVLEFLPPKDSRRADYETLLRQLSTRLLELQGSDGFWRSSLTQQDAYPMPESSGTAFFTFAMAWGVRNDVLDRATFLPAVRRGWAGLASAVDQQGRLGWVQPPGKQPAASTAGGTNDYATGALLLAGVEILGL